MRRPYLASRLGRSPRRPVAALAGLVLAAAVLPGCSSDDGPDSALDAFLAGWPTGQLDKLGFVTAAGQRIAAGDVAAELKQLSGELADSPPKLRRSGDAKVTNDIATATVAVDWTLPGDVHWQYPTTVRLKHADDGAWQVVWEPTVVHDKLTDGDQLAVRRLASTRAAILDGAGKPIVTARRVVQVGVQPSEVTDPAALTRQLDAAFKAIRPAINPPIDVSDLPKRLREAKPDAFVEVVTLRDEAYRQIKPRIYDLPGTKFRDEQRDLAPTREFARALLGSVDPVQKADMDARPGRFVAGDLVGHGGLQGRYDDQLRGTPGVSVIVARKGPDGAVTPTDTEVFRAEPKPGTPVRTTLDVATQTAADAALRGDRHVSALVAMRISDGALVAVANGPDGGAQNHALTAQVPPGSTFKMVSALGLLDLGAVDLDTPVACPKTFTVDGRSFKNANNFALGTVPFRVDFARSCNTAFTALAPKLGDQGLAEAGRSLGLEGSWTLGVDAFTGKVSAGGSAAERAAAAFGQGTTVVSPVAMAAATAAVARGHWQAPTLLREPAPGAKAPDGPKLKESSVGPLRTMMRQVVTAGTATQLATAPGGPVYGKTGTAEYDDNPAHTHAWFVGWQGDIAFAVFVEKGGSSSATAVPIAVRFLRALAAAR
ncbi:Cell division protein FtsI/penicillin-binding protein 2 [Micromonospora pattaloongensis]|uniref:Cell division protein FtsI/penicillin-binding protein 2 n=1 Tax=Micromonospora pattaloongensis TaxID=405436 RepID=A0A1H3LM59_9ACTN|nr:penicillin-binding transpeptidase domain-containing protein [Micromonospora pattaloongensis]SDY65627.1 Cell division protein FtsI/penicillin-binding protein 2 [Micromonospora pattaloongensis]